jgi:beta-glucosidase
MTFDEEIEARITISNTGKYDGKEIVQMYIQDLYGSVVRPVKELKGFKKIILKQGESQEIIFQITKYSLAFWNEKMEFLAEPGAFKLYIGTNSDQVKEADFEFIA